MQVPTFFLTKSTKSNIYVDILAHKEREERIKIVKEKQTEERHKKLEELKAQAEQAQRLREQKEEERRKKIDEVRSKENEKRAQVEERKRAIYEAEKERREYIVKRNQERDQRLDARRRNSQSQIVFAFGSSTPRMLDNEMGSAWAYRRFVFIRIINFYDFLI